MARRSSYALGCCTMKLPFRRSAHVERDIADLLTENKVVARFTGAMEFGPRALGGRCVQCEAPGPRADVNIR